MLFSNRKLSYCRYAPQELRRQYKCRKPSKFYFYNVASARCEALSGVCTTSENKFPTFDSCMKSCIVQSEDLSEEEWTIWNLYNQDSRYYYAAVVAQVIFHKIEKQQNNCQKFLWYEKRGNRVKSSQETEDSLGI